MTPRKAFLLAALVLLLYIIGLSLTAVSTQRAANALFDTEISSTLAGGVSGLVKLEDELEVFRHRFRRLKAWAFPARQVAKLAGVVPPVDRQRQGAELLLERLDLDYEIAVVALELAHLTLDLQSAVLDGSISIDDSGQVSVLRDSLVNLKMTSIRVLEKVESASEIETRLDDLGVVGPVKSLNYRLSESETRLGQIAKFSFLLSDVLLSDIELLTSMSSTLNDLRRFSSGEISNNELSVLIDDLVIRTKYARGQAVEMADSAPASIMDSEYGQTVRSLRDLNVSLHRLFTGIDTILGAAVGSFDSLKSASGALFEDGRAITEMLSALIEKEDELSDSAVLISESVEVLLKTGEKGPVSLGAFGDVLRERIGPLLELSFLLEGAPRVLADVIAIEGETRRYLMLGQSSDELRAAGGFTSSAWLMTFRSGALIENEYLNIAKFEDLDSLDGYPEASEALQLHMDAGILYMRDVGWNPHFPSVGRLAADIYEIEKSVRIDGVISMTQWSFIELVSVLGGIETESGPVAASELMSVMEKGTDEQGTKFLATLFDSLIDSLSGDRIQSSGVNLLRTINSLFKSKDLMIYSEDPAIQSLIFDIGWDGGLPISPRDRLAIIDSNVGWNKVDRNIDRQFRYEVDLTDMARPLAKLNIGYTNNSIVNENICGIQSHVPDTYDVLLNDCYWNYLRVYIPVGARLIESDDLPLGQETIAARVKGLRVGSPTVNQMFDNNGDYISGLLVVDPQSSRYVTFVYELPGLVLVKNGEFLEYTLDVVVQAGTRGRAGTVAVKMPAGYELVSVVPAASNSSNDLVVIDVDPSEDQAIKIIMRESSD